MRLNPESIVPATKQTLVRLATPILTLAALSGCGTTFHPRAPGDGAPVPGSESIARGPQIEDAPMREGCRVTGRSGWIAVAYTVAGERCPPNRDPEDPYNGATLLRYDLQPRGAKLVVCADQPVPRGWQRATDPVEGECVGARVRDGSPTRMVIRRVR